MSNYINESIQINKHKIKNRILMPPLVCFNWADEDGFETYPRHEHYGKRAKGGTGLIVVEATAICKEGRLAGTELGLWKDEHIPQFERIAKSCRSEEAIVIVQLVHAGMESVGSTVVSSSEVEVKDKLCHAMSLEQIQQLKEDFVSAALEQKKLVYMVWKFMVLMVIF